MFNELDNYIDNIPSYMNKQYQSKAGCPCSICFQERWIGNNFTGNRRNNIQRLINRLWELDTFTLDQCKDLW